MRVIILSLALSFLGTSAIANPTARLSPQSVASRLNGLLMYQADEFEIHMSSCAVEWQSGRDTSADSAIYLYQEQARHDRLDKPYRQRLLKLSAPDSETVISDSFRLVMPDLWIGLCRDETRDRIFAQSDLLPVHCTVTLKQSGDDFIGKTPEPGCPSNYRGASFVRNHIILTTEGMQTFDQGVDADGNRIWGSDGEPYRFRKISP